MHRAIAPLSGCSDGLAAAQRLVLALKYPRALLHALLVWSRGDRALPAQVRF